MKTICYFVIIYLFLLFFGCKSEPKVQIRVQNDVLSTDYLGNGVEWDPYDEAPCWGSAISEKDWQKLFKRLDYMKPQYVRCMINSPFSYYDKKKGSYDKTRNIESISRLLDYCTQNGITVIYGEFNPPSFDMKESLHWVDMSVDYLNHLVNELGFKCIRYFNIFNEPDGNWSSTNGNYEMWKKMLYHFHDKMLEYPGLVKQVQLAGPDAVIEYENPESMYDAEGWLKQTIADANSIVGIYDLHAYPGQAEVRSGNYSGLLAEYKQHIPADKKIILGEAGYKYWRPADSALMTEYNKRLINHPFTKGSDCNMLCYDFFYGIDMPLLAMEVMNAGYSGIAWWMLDDAMHSNGDSGKPEDIKIWGMWNILGEEVFQKPSEEDIRPAFYTWSLMCRYFPAGTDILKTQLINSDHNIYAVSGTFQGKLTVAIVNVGDTDRDFELSLPFGMNDVYKYVYEEQNQKKDADGFPIATDTLSYMDSYQGVIRANSFVLFTDIHYDVNQ